MERAGIQSLPEEVLLHVFSFLTPAELRDPMSGVCAQWWALHRHPRLYRALDLTQDQSSRDVVNWLGYATRLESLAMTRPDCNTILANLPKTDQLLSLNLNECESLCHYSSNLKVSTFLNVLKNSPILRTLTLEGFFVSELIVDNGMSRVFYKLRTVHLVRLICSSKCDVLDVVLNCPRLEELKVYECRCGSMKGRVISLSDAEITEICDRLQTTLRVLHLDCGRWTQRGLSSLSRCTHLQDLGVFSAQDLNSKCLLVFGSIPSLRKLEMSHCEGPGEDVWIRLVTSPKMRRLESLVLKECSFTNRVAEAIGESLRNLGTLALLKQGRCSLIPHNQRICASGLESILHGCSKLATLRLCWVAIESQSSLLMIPQLLPGLEFVSISPTPKRLCLALLDESMPYLGIDRDQKDVSSIFAPVWLCSQDQ